MSRVVRSKKVRAKEPQTRLRVLWYFFVLSAVFLVGRLAQVQLFEGRQYSALASGQRNAHVALEPVRGNIFVHQRGLSGETELRAIATNQKLNLVYANPNKVENPRETGEALADIFGIGDEEEEDKQEREALVARLSKPDDPYEPLQHFVHDDVVAQIDALGLPGIYFAREDNRFYPSGPSFAHITGFYGNSTSGRQGRYGIEGEYEEELAGEGGSKTIERDAAGRIIALGDLDFEPPVNGADVVLTLDYTVQSQVCSQLQQAVTKFAAERGTVLVMDPFDGSVMALCNYPTFDPEKYFDVEDIAVYANPAVSEAYEPGSIFKAITMAAALDSEVLKPSDIFVDEGQTVIGEDTIRNANREVYGEQTFTQVLENSINTGMIEAMRLTGSDYFKEYVREFGFGEPTGLGLPSEAAGTIASLDNSSEIYAATASFGQGITVTPLQMAAAFSAIANGGMLKQPYIVSEIRYEDGTVVRNEPKDVRRVLSRQSATTLGAMLVSVVKNGQAKYAQVPGYYVAGKTGTAQIAKTTGRGYSEATNQSFIGFAPVEKPRFVLFVWLHKPQNSRFSSASAAPTFGEMATFLLNYFQVPPDF